jgi:hypothetical protein
MPESATWWWRFQQKTRYQPSPKGATNANASPTPFTDRKSSGGSVSRTSASMSERTAERPGYGNPSARRTTLCTPSAPTT